MVVLLCLDVKDLFVFLRFFLRRVLYYNYFIVSLSCCDKMTEKAIQYGVNIESSNTRIDYKKYSSAENQYISNLKLDI
jgi:hypothetical protein